MKKLFILGVVVFLITAPLLTSAANPCAIDPVTGKASPSQLPICVNQIYVWSLGVAALLAVLMTVLGGYYYMTSAGNAEQADKGKEYIWGAVIGLTLLFGAYLLLRTINPDLVNLPINSFTCLDVANKDKPECQPQPSSGGGGGGGSF